MLVKVSNTQIELARLCWRRWAFTYLHKRFEPKSPALFVGIRVHEILEAYLEYGTVPDPNETLIINKKTWYVGKIALGMMPAGDFPAPKSGEVEYNFEFERNGILWNGKIDYHKYFPPGIDPRPSALLIDHKTSADPKQWGETDITLPTATQPIIYVNAIIDRYGMTDGYVTAIWNYGCTDAKPQKSKTAKAYFDVSKTRALFETNVEPTGQLIRQYRIQNADPLTLPCNPDACFAYHKKCLFIDDCKLTNSERLGAIMSGNQLVADLLAETNGAAPPPPPANTGGPPIDEPAPPPTAPPVDPADAVNPIDAPPPHGAHTAPPVDPPPPASGPPVDAPAGAALPPARRGPGRPPKAGAAAKPAPPPVDTAAPVYAPAPGLDLGSDFVNKLITEIARQVVARMFPEK